MEQSRRWDIFLHQVECALQTGKEIHILGDMNLDFFEFANIDNISSDSHTGRLAPLIKSFRDRIIHQGFFQLIKDPTHTWQGKTTSLLDHYWTNQPEKVSNISAKETGSSYHMLISGTRNTKKLYLNQK